MTDKAKVILSELELSLVNNSEWILTKHAVIQKVGELLGMQVPVINETFIAKIASDLPELAGCRPKISKGERYRELPYVLLDYPAIFSKTDVFALRTMFWWGNFMAVTVHLKGKYKMTFEAAIENNLRESGSRFYLSTGGAEWEHHFGEDNYTAVSLEEKEGLHKKIVQPSFIKVALKYDLHQWNNMNELLQSSYTSLAALLKS